MDYIYKAVHPTQPEMFAAIVLASAPAEGGKPLITLHGRYPRIIHGEVLTHRKKSKNGRSSRAVPTKKVLEEVRASPFVPWHWGKNQKGMQGGEDWNAPLELFEYQQGPDEREDGYYDFSREAAWLKQRDHAADVAEGYMNAGYHKQIPNRLLEPFSWMDTLISSTSWSNFLHLRDHKDAEPHFQDFARLVKEALTWVRDNNKMQCLKPGQWHLPYIVPNDWMTVIDHLRNDVKINPTPERQVEVLKRISAARCARISYTPFDGDGSFERELERFDLLISSDRLHASPTEHQATPDRYDAQYPGAEWDSPGLHGNLEGWVQFRKTLGGEYHDTDEDFWGLAA